jgi:tetratricopeptide (TPR) repeat protein
MVACSPSGQGGIHGPSILRRSRWSARAGSFARGRRRGCLRRLRRSRDQSRPAPRGLHDALAQSLAYSNFSLANRNKLAAYLNRAGAYLEKGENDWVILDANRVVELDPTVAQAHYYLAVAYYNKRDYDQAIASATQVIGLAPQGGALAAAYNVRGRAYTEKAKPDLAVADLTKAIGLDSKGAAFFYNRAIAYSRMSGGTPKAIADLQTVVQLAPADSTLRANAQTGLSQLQGARPPTR